MPRPRPRTSRRPLFGPICGPELASIGIETVEDLRELGWEEACARWAAAYPLRLNVNAFTGIVAAIEGVDWRTLSADWKVRIRGLKSRLARDPSFSAGAPIGSADRRRS